MIAEDLYYEIIKQHPNRNYVISVFEDGENGAILEFSK
jgi:hypothetical protein